MAINTAPIAAGAGFSEIKNNINENFKEIDTRLENIGNIEAKMVNISYGYYTGDGEAQRTYTLGFTPDIVEIYSENGIQFQSAGGNAYGGLALKGHPCVSNLDNSTTAIGIVENGFTIGYNSEKRIHTNRENLIYYYKAYKI